MNTTPPRNRPTPADAADLFLAKVAELRRLSSEEFASLAPDALSAELPHVQLE
jgi:hypothetical protein